MAAATNYCFTSLQVCRLRATLLDATGKPDPGAESVIVTDALIDLKYDLVLKAGAKFDLDNGCGVSCLTFQDRDKIEGVNLTMELCKLDAQLIALLTQSHEVVVGNVSRGFAIPDVDEELDQEVAIEAWTRAWDGDAAAVVGGNVWHDRFIFPRTTWTLGGATLENNPLKIPLTGHGKSNGQWGDGPANDLPWGEYTTAMGVWFDDGALPEAVCGYQALVAS